MKGKIISSKIRYSVYIVSLVLAVVAIYFMLPTDENFDRYFEVGKPWAYETVMAPKNFAIYKSEIQLENERAEALRELEPYVINSKFEIYNSQFTTQKQNLSLSNREYNWLVDRLNEVYGVGVIALQDKQEFERVGVSRVVVLDGNSVKGKVDLSDIFTPKTAYDYILAQAKKEFWIDDNILKTSNLSEYIEPNVTIDRAKTEQAMQIIVEGVMLTSGMVQKGEKIVDRGEVITEDTYQILRSLQRAMDGEELTQRDGVWKVVGDVALIVVMLILLAIYFVQFRPKVLDSIRATEFMILMILGMLGLLALVTQYIELTEYVVPFAMLPLVVRVFFDSRTALYVHIVTILLAAQMVPDATEFVVLQILAGMVAVSSLKDMNSRSQLVQSAVLIFFVYAISFVAMELSRGVAIGTIDWTMLFVFVVR